MLVDAPASLALAATAARWKRPLASVCVLGGVGVDGELTAEPIAADRKKLEDLCRAEGIQVLLVAANQQFAKVEEEKAPGQLIFGKRDAPELIKSVHSLADAAYFLLTDTSHPAVELDGEDEDVMGAEEDEEELEG